MYSGKSSACVRACMCAASKWKRLSLKQQRKDKASHSAPSIKEDGEVTWEPWPGMREGSGDKGDTHCYSEAAFCWWQRPSPSAPTHPAPPLRLSLACFWAGKAIGTLDSVHSWTSHWFMTWGRDRKQALGGERRQVWATSEGENKDGNKMSNNMRVLVMKLLYQTSLWFSSSVVYSGFHRHIMFIVSLSKKTTTFE